VYYSQNSTKTIPGPLFELSFSVLFYCNDLIKLLANTAIRLNFACFYTKICNKVKNAFSLDFIHVAKSNFESQYKSGSGKVLLC
jgi:hypothetical protein